MVLKNIKKDIKTDIIKEDKKGWIEGGCFLSFSPYNREEMNMIAILLILGVVGLTVIGLLFVKVKELHDYGYSWGYSFLQALGGLR